MGKTVNMPRPSTIYAPELDTLINRAKGMMYALDNQSLELASLLFEKIQSVAVCGEDEYRELWLVAERGTIDDFGNYQEYLDDGDVASWEEFEELWLDHYPNDFQWYKLATIAHSDGLYQTVFLGGEQIVEIDRRSPQENRYAINHSKLLDWILASVDSCIESLKSGFYNDYVSLNLPFKKRVGKLLREDLWQIFPESKADHLAEILPNEIKDFAKLIQKQPEESPVGRVPEMTASLFYECCRIGYLANNYADIDGMTSKESYYRHADGRDDGLKDAIENSPENYRKWYFSREKLGHPWEVCRGGNSTHISLYTNVDEDGWWFTLAGSNWGRSVETVKFYLALTSSGYPVYLRDGKELAAMLTGQDLIGIVPEGVIPRYCGSYFPDEKKLLQYMNLPWERTDEVIEAAIWYPVEEVLLA